MTSSFRRWLWRQFSIPLAALPGWTARLRSVLATEGMYVDHETHAVGAPLEWSLAAYDGARLITTESTCAWSGAPISGATPLVEVEGSPVPQHDLSRFGVRCARCGTPIRVQLADMKLGTDVPSCPPCRPIVRLLSAIVRFR